MCYVLSLNSTPKLGLTRAFSVACSNYSFTFSYALKNVLLLMLDQLKILLKSALIKNIPKLHPCLSIITHWHISQSVDNWYCLLTQIDLRFCTDVPLSYVSRFMHNRSYLMVIIIKGMSVKCFYDPAHPLNSATFYVLPILLLAFQCVYE